MNWWKYALGRIAAAGATLWVGLTTLFLALYATPLNPLNSIFGRDVGDETYEKVAIDLDLWRPDGTVAPFWERYLDFLAQFVTFDFGHAWVVPEAVPPVSVADMIAAHTSTTLWLAFWSVVIALGAGIPLGVYAGANEGSWRGRLAAGVGVAQRSAPTFWVGVLVAGAVGGFFSLYPIDGDPSVELGRVFAGVATSGAPGLEWVWIPVPTPASLRALAWTLPAAAVVASTAIAGGIHLGRRGTSAGLDSGYADLARAKGVVERGILRSHVGANLGRALVADLPRYGGSLVVGVVLVEYVFRIDGIGSLWVEAAFGTDLNVLAATTGGFLVFLVGLHLLADLLVAWLDPRGETVTANDGEATRPRPDVGG